MQLDFSLIVAEAPQRLLIPQLRTTKLTKVCSQGNAQGKYQQHSQVDGNKDYLQAALWNGSPVEITIPPASDGKNLHSARNCRSSKSLV